MADNYYQDPLGAPDYSAQGMPSLLSLSNLESLGRGSVAGLFDLPYVIEGMLRGDVDPRMPQRKRVVPSSEQVLATTPRMTQPTPQAGLLETAGAFMSPAPVAAVKPVAKAVGKAVKATEGLPVGMSIKDVGKSAITREGNPIQSAVVLVGDKIFMGRTHGDALNRAVYEGVVRKEGGKYIFPKGAEVNSDLFMTKDGQIIDRLQASKMFDIGASETAIEKGLMQNNPPKSMTVDSYIEQATALKKQREQSLYPQQAALDLAQQRAALPVSEGGLGLLAGNTPEMRAQAMGFEESGYSGTSKDFINYDPSKSSGAGSGSREGPLGAWLTDDPRVASEFANWSSRGQGGDVVYPLMIRGSNPYQPSAYSEIKDILDANTQFSRPPYRMMQDKINYENAIRDLEAKGDYVALRNTLTDAIDNPITQFLVTDPTRLRSRFAAFDPFRKDVATATAMGVALPDLLAAEPTPQPQSSGLLYPFP